MSLFTKCFLSHLRREIRNNGGDHVSPSGRLRVNSAFALATTVDQVSLLQIVVELQRAAGVEMPKDQVEKEVGSIFCKLLRAKKGDPDAVEGIAFPEVVNTILASSRALQLHGMLAGATRREIYPLVYQASHECQSLQRQTQGMKLLKAIFGRVMRQQLSNALRAMMVKQNTQMVISRSDPGKKLQLTQMALNKLSQMHRDSEHEKVMRS